jgi:hypothetical protein
MASLVGGPQVTSIGAHPFHWCDRLTSVIFSSLLVMIGFGAFSQCSALHSIDFGAFSQVAELGPLAFGSCFSLRAPHFSDSLRRIGAFCFRGCNSLDNITIS